MAAVYETKVTVALQSFLLSTIDGVDSSRPRHMPNLATKTMADVGRHFFNLNHSALNGDIDCTQFYLCGKSRSSSNRNNGDSLITADDWLLKLPHHG